MQEQQSNNFLNSLFKKPTIKFNPVGFEKTYNFEGIPVTVRETADPTNFDLLKVLFDNGNGIRNQFTITTKPQSLFKPQIKVGRL